MPYIDKKAREKFEPELDGLRRKLLDGLQYAEPTGPIPKGELTYLTYVLGRTYFRGRESYTNISTAISCLNDAAGELKRRYLDPHEDAAIKRNGDIE